MKRLSCWCFVFVLTTFCSPLFSQQDYRQAAVAGSFYPGNSDELSQMVEHLISGAPDQKIEGDLIGIVAPHAGYVFSGSIAAAAYKQVLNRVYDVVVIIAPSHRDPFSGATIYPGEGYITPLGKMDMAKKVCRELVSRCDNITFSNQGHRQEHALEVQLPFLQTVFSTPPEMIAMVVGSCDWNMCQAIGSQLGQRLQGKKALIIASTDLYHGYSYEECESIDNKTIEAMLKADPRKLFQGFKSQTLQACGGPAVVIMRLAAEALGATDAALLAHTNSNDVTGERGGYVVGYSALAYYAGDAEIPDGRIEYPSLEVHEQKFLLQSARKAIEQYLKNKTIAQFEPISDRLKQKRGVFVTLNKNGRLRGCIGAHQAVEPVYKLVPDRAVAAAFQDPRFPPLTQEELDDISIKVSVYTTNVYAIKSIEEFEMGKHGIIMIKDGRGATFLPEVPLEAGWKRKEEEMRQLCYKAGLNLDAWKNGAQFYVYETQEFGEEIF